MNHIRVLALPAAVEPETIYYVSAADGRCVIYVSGNSGEARQVRSDLAPVVYEQSMPSPLWTISHGLGRRPASIVVEDTNGDQCIGSVAHPDANTAVLTFSASFAGTAYVF